MTARSATRVVVVDTNGVLRAGLRLILDRAPDIHCVGEASDPVEASRMIGACHPDVAVVDAQGNHGDRLDGVRVIHREHPGVRTVVLSGDGDLDDVREAFRAGADGYVQPTGDDDELLEAIRTVAHGSRYVHHRLGALLAQPREPHPLDELTCREREVLQLLALGYGNQEIAARLHLSPRTIETHRANLMHKLRIGSRAEIVRIALEHGMLTVEAAETPPG